jgi:glycosyltransferase involved in cell wall biosynthesis
MIFMIVPCYNEEFRLNLPYWNEILNTLTQVNFVFVNDGSTDETLKILSRLTQKNVQILNLPMNVGKGEAIRSGFTHVLCGPIEPSVLGFIDSDGAFHITDILSFISLVPEVFQSESPFAGLIASRVALSGRNISRSWFRHYIGRLISTYLFLGWERSPYDSQCGFKLFKVDSDLIESIVVDFKTTWFFDLELILRLSALRSNAIMEIPLNYWTEVEGSKINYKRFLGIIREICRMKRIIRKFLRKLKEQ